ncbi:MAG: zinc-ribbon domain-containing protein [Acidobacteriaceae bacterium]|nr:zinc-ribbon domain-containing protein [Acidobacteriaceae bacterium]
MPFCTNCGTNVDPGASFCFHCGAAQPRPGAQFADFLDGLSDRTAAILCYIPVFGVIPAIVFLASRKYRGNSRIRFDAFQALYLFVAWLIIASAAPTILYSGFPGWGVEHIIVGGLKITIFICWIYLLIKAANEEQVRLPVIGDLAARSTTEQL